MTPRALIARALGRTATVLRTASERVRPHDARDLVVQRWFADQGDETLRLDYPLSRSSIVIDVGGYAGQWSSDIYGRYRSRVFVFEPVPAFAARIERRFADNPDVRSFAFGLGSTDAITELSVSADESSAFKPGRDTVNARVRQADAVLTELGIDHIDLMKVNIEGGEYDLLDHLVAVGRIPTITDLQVQFHDFVPGAQSRVAGIHDVLARTHTLTYEYPFVWENWRLRR